MFAKNIGRIFLGSASPPQLVLACLFGSLLGFMPGFAQAAGLIVLLSIFLLFFNCNLALAAMVGLVAKSLSLLLMPLTFSLGRLLLDGPFQGVYIAAINAPVLALFGLEYYLTTGGVLMGMATGLALGFLLSRSVVGIRRSLAEVEANSVGFKAILDNRFTRILLKLLMGGVPSSGYAELLSRKSAAIRGSGVAVIIALSALCYGGLSLLDGAIAARLLRNALEEANGATVDLGSADLDLANASFRASGLAIADPNALEMDLLRADRISMDISAADLLRKRLRIEEIEVAGGALGGKRETPGRIIGGSPEPGSASPEGEKPEKVLDDYLADADVWKHRLGRAKRLFDRFSGSRIRELIPEVAGEGASRDGSREGQEESFEAWLDREIQARGYSDVKAAHLIQGSPTLRVDSLAAAAVTTASLDGETLDIEMRNFSTQPNLVDPAPSLMLRSSADTVELALELAGISAAGGVNRLELILRGLPAEDWVDEISAAGGGALSGGTLDLRLDGAIEDRGGAWIDLPVAITIRDTTIRFSNQLLDIDRLEVPVRIRGPLENPSILVNEEKLFASLTRVAGEMLGNRAREIATQKIQEKMGDRLGDRSRELLDGLGGKKGIGGLFGQ